MQDKEIFKFGTFTYLVLFAITGELYTEAADAAMAAMKGRLANKWYQLAEEAWAEIEEE
jgi:hypothetical protein